MNFASTSLVLCLLWPAAAHAQPRFLRQDLQLANPFKAFFERPYAIGFTADGTFQTPLPVAAVTEKAADVAWPTRLGGISLEMRDSSGVRRLAALAYVSPEQVQFLVPEDAALGEGVLPIQSEPVGSVQVEPLAPGIFLLQGWNMLPAARNLRIEADGTRTEQPVYDCPPRLRAVMRPCHRRRRASRRTSSIPVPDFAGPIRVP